MAKRILPILLFGVAVCGPAGPPANLVNVCRAGHESTDAGDVEAVETGNEAFAVGLLGTLADAGGNLILSPYSASSSLELAYAGAAGTTATEMAQVLGLGSAAADPGPAAATIACTAESDGEEDGNQLSVGNALFGQAGVAFTTSFTSTLADQYGAPLQTVDFAGNPSGAASQISGWISSATNGLITSGAPNIAPGTVLVLVTAIYFKGTWENGFDPSRTQAARFETGPDAGVQAQMMSQTGSGVFGLFAGGGVSVVEMPYKGGRIAFDVALPADPGGLPALLASLTPSQLDQWFGDMEQTQLSLLEIPTFSLTTQVDLTVSLQAMGMGLAFQRGMADFSGIDGQQDLYLQSVSQSALIEVDETGTVAAAATSTSVSCVNAVRVWPSFVADHPFLFLLRDVGTGTILFAGTVTDPTQG